MALPAHQSTRLSLVNLANLAALVQIHHMRVLPKIGTVTGPLFVLLAVGCQASVDSVDPADSGSSGGSGGSATSSGGAANLAGTASLPPGSEPASLLPARIRRLTVAEYQATVADPGVIGSAANDISAGFVPDSRQNGFTVNAAQRVDPVFARQLAEAAITLAASIRQQVTERAPCQNTAAEHDQCARTFISQFGEKAYRRPLADDEIAQLMTVFQAGFDGGSYEEGIELVARAMLQSASFLYLTEIGEAPAATVKLTPYELASSISYLVQGRPPSAELLDLAKSGALDTPEGRSEHLTGDKLFNGAERDRVTRVVREWLGIDKAAEIAKDLNVYKQFEQARSAIADESQEFIKALLAQDGKGSLRELLAGNWTMANQNLSPVYGPGVPQGAQFERFATPDRLGILNQPAFLSVFAHAHEPAPVLRGVAVARRIACMHLADPSSAGLSVVPPPPDPNKSTRERFAIHAQDAGCAGCHKLIDNFGFAFEHFDGMGAYRADDHGPVNSSVVVGGTDFDGSFADSNELALALSTSPQVRQCFARQMFRGLAATSDLTLRASEDDFVKYWDTTLTREGGEVKDVDIIGTIGAFLTSPAFNFRRAQ